ncbi:unnamed protein product [Durusdinium trenchii]|uniref:Uncharacterized protein n=1 Tax=Durusdinium trenchii TaxID=1381693 RepID=A0ABP0NY97_9DINO
MPKDKKKDLMSTQAADKGLGTRTSHGGFEVDQESLRHRPLWLWATLRRSWGHDIEDLQELADNSVNVLAPEEFALLFGLESRLSPDTNRSCEAGHSMFDAMTHASDLKASEVEQILLEVEARCGVTFNPVVRIKLWKALRYQWFRGPGKGARRISTRCCRQIRICPPLEWQEQDSKFKFGDLESDRQRQVVRKIKQLAPGETGQSLQTFQFEVYTRSPDLIYEYRDLERCVQEWERRNPRSMIQEDMREEVMRMRLKGVVDSANASIAVRRARAAKLKNFSSTLIVMQLVMFSLCMLMLLTAFTSLNNTPPQSLGSCNMRGKQFLSAMVFFTASIVAGAVSERAKQDPLIRELKKTVLSCERLIERISDFRIATEELRLQKNEARKKGVPVGLNLNVSQETHGSSQREVFSCSLLKQNACEYQRARKKKKEKDAALELWAPDAGKLDGQEIQMMQKQLAHSFRRLPAPGGEFQRQGGDRMRSFHQSLGGVAEDEMCVQITSKQQQKRQAYVEKLKEQALAKMPKNPPPPALAMNAANRERRVGEGLGWESGTWRRFTQIDKNPKAAGT